MIFLFGIIKANSLFEQIINVVKICFKCFCNSFSDQMKIPEFHKNPHLQGIFS